MNLFLMGWATDVCSDCSPQDFLRSFTNILNWWSRCSKDISKAFINHTYSAHYACCALRLKNKPTVVLCVNITSAAPHVSFIEHRGTECTSGWHSTYDAAVKLPVSITWVEWRCVCVCVTGRNDRGSPAFTLVMTELCERLPSAAERAAAGIKH